MVKASRRTIMAGAAAAAAAGALTLEGCAREPALAGELGGADWRRGHALRDRRFPQPQGPEEHVGVLIAGGGVAGLAAGWRLAEAGMTDFALLELEDSTGGNARSGHNAISAYPLGAHYLPVPNREAKALRHMLRQFGIMTGEAPDGAPIYDPYQLCADLEERLLWHGGWQEGLFPQTGLSAADRAQRSAFDRAMDEFRSAAGADGRPAFAIPMAFSSTDPRFTALDTISFAHWLDQKGWSSTPLRAYLRYCCRDDYGTEPEQVSAWAGVHYFAARRGWAANGDGDRELTWPEGNARLAGLMAGRIRSAIRTGHSVFRVERDGDAVLVDSFDHARQRSTRIRARCAILAMPHFVSARLMPSQTPAGSFSYAPWIVANVSVSRQPRGKGVPLAWDNVSAGSDSLGYVVATHQSSGAGDGPTVLTWYMPLSRQSPQEARRIMLSRPLQAWQAVVRDDVLTMNPDLADAIERIDIWQWGHAMIRPVPGFLSDPVRRTAASSPPPILYAHSDLSGLSLFEEAHHRGIVAAEAAMAHVAHPFESLI